MDYTESVALPPPGDLPDPGIKPASFMSPALAGGFFTANVTWVAQCQEYQLSISGSTF